jgi:xanthine dehydrogenase YagT iron-sulfur-binding subunit
MGDVTVRVNGTPHSLDVDSRMSLLDLLRERLGLTGTKRAAITACAARARCTAPEESPYATTSTW